MAGLEQEPSHRRATRRTVVAGSVAVVLVVALAFWLASRVNSHPGNRPAAAGSASHPSKAATPSVVRTNPKWFSAPLKRLPALSKADAAGRIALPWSVLNSNHANARVEIVFASRSCEHVDGIDVEQDPTSVVLNVLATNIAGMPSCDVVPELYRAVVRLSAPLAARTLIHASVDKTYWPTNPFDQP
jgi:hypothetical protein